MKRTAALIAASGLLLAPVAADAATKPVKKKPTTRTVTWDYQGPAGPHVIGSSVSLCTDSTCTSLGLEPYELKAVVTVTDDAGQDVALLTSVDGVDSLTCGSGELALSKSTQLDLRTVLDPDCPGLPTTGTVSVTITGLK